MFTAYIIVTVLTVAANAYAAVVDFRRPQWVLDNMSKWGGSDSWLSTLGALGRLVGIGIPLIGVAAGVGLVLFFVGAIAVVIRAGWYAHLPWPSTYLLLAICVARNSARSAVKMCSAATMSIFWDAAKFLGNVETSGCQTSSL
ncbi:MAG TPA: DoxX family protein [Candidatus Udaeobacter sp.]|jgi:hypothetical protein|nr:DoxX family protein [Candidatus Udaeobacter sp.]